MKILRPIALWIPRLLLAAFFAFVGYWKALGPIPALTEHHAWVAGFPDWFARFVGWSEIACAIALLVPARTPLNRVALAGAGALIVNQIAAGSVHVSRGEGAHALPQTALICALLVFIIFCLRKSWGSSR